MAAEAAAAVTVAAAAVAGDLAVVAAVDRPTAAVPLEVVVARSNHSFPVLLWVALSGGTFFGVTACDNGSQAEAELKKELDRLDQKRLDDFYETEWVKCVNDLGMDRCRIIQETGFRECHNHRSLDPNLKENECVEVRFKDRLNTLPKKDEPVPQSLPAEAPENVREQF